MKFPIIFPDGEMICADLIVKGDAKSIRCISGSQCIVSHFPSTKRRDVELKQMNDFFESVALYNKGSQFYKMKSE